MLEKGVSENEAPGPIDAHTHTHFQVSGHEKGTAKRGTGLRRRVYTYPHKHTTSR